jgi:DNA-binding transcriptional MocR family regulator
MEAVARVGAPALARRLGDWRRTGGSDYVALAVAVRGLIRDGRLALGVRLPAERSLAVELAVSRTTVTAAYRLLRDQGYLRSRRGAGSDTALPEGQRLSTSGLWAPDDEALIDLGCAAPPPPAELTAAARQAADELAGYATSHGYYPAGLPELRSAIADRFTARGVPTGPAEILVTSGAQQGLDLVLRLLTAPGERILVESPSYPNALTALAAARLRADPIPVTDGGWDLEPVLPAITAGRYRVTYLIPDFHNPTGAVLPEPQRAALIAAAYRGGGLLVADETFAELSLTDRPAPPPMAGLDRHRRVITVGGMSKSYWGGLRVGWIRATPALIPRLAAVRAGVDMGGAVLDQLVARALLARAATVLPVRRELLRTQRDALVGAVREHLPGARFRVPDGGLCLWVELDEPVASALATAAEAYGVRLAPGPRFGTEGTFERYLRLPFARPANELVEAVRRIAAARADLDALPPGRPATPAVVA